MKIPRLGGEITSMMSYYVEIFAEKIMKPWLTRLPYIFQDIFSVTRGELSYNTHNPVIVMLQSINQWWPTPWKRVAAVTLSKFADGLRIGSYEFFKKISG